MFESIMRRKLMEKVEKILDNLDLEDILQEQAEEAIDGYPVEDVVLQNIEYAAKKAIETALYGEAEDLIIEALIETFDDMI